MRWLEGWLLALLAAYSLHNVLLSLDRPIWSPVDEMAHYDYVDRLSSELRLPAPGERLSDYTRTITLERFRWAIPPGFDGTPAGMGVAGRSYEAHQPPLYYLLLAAPNAALKAAGVAPETQIRTLRVVNALFTVAAALLVLLALRDLAAVTGASPIWGYVLAPALLVVEPSAHYAIGNDRLSLLAGAACGFLLVRHWRTGRDADARRAAWCVLLSLLTKYSNGFLVPLFAASVVARMARREGRPSIGRLAAVAWPIALVALYPLANWTIYDDPLKTRVTIGYFAKIASPVPGALEFVRVLVSSSLCFVALRPLPHLVHLLFVALLVKNLALGGYRLLVRREPAYAVVLVSAALSLAVLATALALPRLQPAVFWFDFRHFGAYLPFWLIGAFSFPSLGGTRARKTATAVALALTVLLPVYASGALLPVWTW